LLLLSFFTFNEINNLSAFNVAFSSIPTAPTNHLHDGWTLSKNTRGQKGADWADDPVQCIFPSGTGDNRIRMLSSSEQKRL
jgi:hypothetical protein